MAKNIQLLGTSPVCSLIYNLDKNLRYAKVSKSLKIPTDESLKYFIWDFPLFVDSAS